MKTITQIINNKELQIGKVYAYIDNKRGAIVVKHEKAKFQNEQHEKDYMASQGAIYLLRNLENDLVFDLHSIDYLETRYRIFPIDADNIGHILKISEFRNNKTNQRILLKHFFKNI